MLELFDQQQEIQKYSHFQNMLWQSRKHCPHVEDKANDQTQVIKIST